MGVSSRSHLYNLIQCERALPSDCQYDVVSPFVILLASWVLDETSIRL